MRGKAFRRSRSLRGRGRPVTGRPKKEESGQI